MLKTQRKATLKLYTINGKNQEEHIDKILSGEIIISTNLAGRGTDIDASALQLYGGMHVIVTFESMNQRVKDQAFGRTARQGERGTGQVILNFSRMQNKEFVSLETL